MRRLDALGERVPSALSGSATYRRQRPVDGELLDRWESVRAADRLSEQVEGDRKRSSQILEHARHDRTG